ncbi:hypothetical protein [Bradyrhizobium embrapense]
MADPEYWLKQDAKPCFLNATPRSSSAARMADRVDREVFPELSGVGRRAQGRIGAIASFSADLIKRANHPTERRIGWVKVPLYPSAFTSRPVGFHQFSTVHKALAEAGLIEIEVGYVGGAGANGGHAGRLTRFRAAPALLGIAEAHGIYPSNVREHFAWNADLEFWPKHGAAADVEESSSGSIELRTVSKSRRIAGRLEQEKTVLAIPDTHPMITGLRNDMDEINDYLGSQAYSGTAFAGLVRKFEMPAGSSVDDYRFDFGGRLDAAGGFQTISKEARAEISINGSRVAEIDVKASHLTIALGLLGQNAPLPADPYAIGLDDFPRNVVKLFFISSFSRGRLHNVHPKSPGGWHSATAKMFSASIPEFNAVAHPLTKLLPAVLAHYPILHDFHLRMPGGWGTFQHVESNVLLRSMQSLKVFGVPALPIHDSLIVPAAEAGKASAALTEAFLTLTGVRPRLHA